jgi:hypothetical protein
LPVLRRDVGSYRVVVGIGIWKMVFVHNIHLLLRDFRIERRTPASSPNPLRRFSRERVPA